MAVNKLENLIKYMKRGLIERLRILIDLEENVVFKGIYIKYLKQLV